MTPEQSLEAAYQLLRDNGFQNVTISGAGHFWLVKTEKGTSATSDEPDNFWLPHECAQALVDAHKGVAVTPEPEQIGNDETDSETVPEGRAIEGDGRGVGAGSAGVESAEPDVAAEPVLRYGDEEPEETPAEGSVVDEVPEPVCAESGDPSPETPPGAVDLGDADAAPGDAESAEDGATGGGGPLLADDGPAFEGDSDILDADYADIPADDRDFLALEDQSSPAAIEGGDIDPLLIEALTQEDEPVPVAPVVSEPASGVVYFGDDIHIARLAKAGRLLEIATERKAALQDGWTVGEFATLQNLIMRIDQGLIPDDEPARARFLAISERSAAMSRVDAYLTQREQELAGYANPLNREAIAAFNPEEGWP